MTENPHPLANLTAPEALYLLTKEWDVDTIEDALGNVQLAMQNKLNKQMTEARDKLQKLSPPSFWSKQGDDDKKQYAYQKSQYEREIKTYLETIEALENHGIDCRQSCINEIIYGESYDKSVGDSLRREATFQNCINTTLAKSTVEQMRVATEFYAAYLIKRDITPIDDAIVNPFIGEQAVDPSADILCDQSLIAEIKAVRERYAHTEFSQEAEAALKALFPLSDQKIPKNTSSVAAVVTAITTAPATTRGITSRGKGHTAPAVQNGFEERRDAILQKIWDHALTVSEAAPQLDQLYKERQSETAITK